MRHLVLIAVFASGLLLGCGSSLSVTSDFDPAVKFGALKTFMWSSPRTRRTDDPLSMVLVENRVRGAVTKALTKKGFAELKEGQPDFLVIALAGLNQKMSVTDWGYAAGPYWGPYPYGRNIDVNYYTEANLIIDVVLPGAQKQLAWRGIGSGVVDRQSKVTPEEAQARMDYAVDRILADFPPSGGK
jgi:hypothetical protein